MATRWKFVAVLAVFLHPILVAKTEAKPLQADISSLSSQELQYYFGRNIGVPEYRLLNTHQLRRERRSTDDSNTLRYKLNAFDESFQLVLQQSKNLFNAGTLIHRIGATGVPRISSPKRHCYYTGQSENHANSRVFLSTCDGLFGTIIVESGAYIMQPLKDEHKNLENDLAPNHLIFKKPDIGSSASCSTQENRPTEVTARERRARDVSKATRYIETSVVCDDQMHETYGDLTENYVLSILNQVSGLFRDSSLDSNIVLHISKITIIEKPQNSLNITNELDRSLNNFCEWQKSEQSDVSLLITKRDLVSAGNAGVTGKATDVGGACNPDKRCVITEDHGPSGLVFTIAHELGHSLGMYHDGGFTDCPNRRNIMASVNSGGSDAFHWSKCSNMDMINFLSSPKSSCLTNSPLAMPEYDLLTIPMAGYYINVTHQCRMTFGSMATAAVSYVDTEEMCDALRCDIDDMATGVTNQIPPLDGSSCGKSNREVCMRGTCMKVYSTLDCNGGPCAPLWLEGAWESCTQCEQLRSVVCVEIHTDDGTTRLADESSCPIDKPDEVRSCCTAERFQYDTGEYGSCSVSCGNGLQTRSVICRDTTTGNTVAHAMCSGDIPRNTQLCSFEACSTTSSFSYIIGSFGGCSVTCGMGVQSRNVNCVSVNNIMVGSSNCINAGLGSIPTTQACDTGVTCPSEDIYRFVTGALQDCTVTCGTGIQIRIVMCMNQDNAVVAEQLCTSQALVRPSEAIPCILETCETVSSFRYMTGNYGLCSVSCGSGTQTRSVTCINRNSQVVTDSFCTAIGLPKPSTTQSCQLEACSDSTFAFVTGNFGPCSASCESGLRSRSVFCVNQDSLSYDFRFCLDFGLAVPSTIEECTLEPCPGEITYSYIVGELSECSASCGDGIQIRSVFCSDNNNNFVDEDNCVNAALVMPAKTVICFLVECGTYTYFVGEYSLCSVTCGGGVQVRIVECRNDNTGSVEEDHLCADETPIAVQTCAENACDIRYEYVVGPFGTCGCDNLQSRIVLCVMRSGTSLGHVDNSICVDAGLSMPSATGMCEAPPSCDGPTWASTQFSTCSVTCGLGVRSRLVFCVAEPGSQDIVDDAICQQELKLDATEVCDTTVECPNQYIWLFSDWGSCSVTCGEGVETRSVTCYSLADTLVTEMDPSRCPAADEPPSVRECVHGPCNGVWQASDYNECSVSCGCGGIRTRTVSCYTFKGSGVLANEAECIAEDRPIGTEDCFVAKCPSPYGCDQTYDIDIGTQYQLQSPNYPDAYPNDILCHRDFVISMNLDATRRRREADLGYHIEITFTDFDVEASPNCEFDYLQILDVQGTNSVILCGILSPLPYVYQSEGPVIQIRFETDASNNRRGFAATYEVVSNEGAYYVPGEFEDCSLTCGDGVQTRTVECYLNDILLDISECAMFDKPASAQPCKLGDCPTSDACMAEVLRTEPGLLSSPNFPSNYNNNSTCVNRIVAPLGKVVAITTLFFALEDSVDCSADALVLDDINSAAVPSRFCGNRETVEVIYTSLTNEMFVLFTTDESNVDRGFSITYAFVDPSLNLCNGLIQTNKQTIYSPGYPADYDIDVTCHTSIISSEGCVELVFHEVNLGDGCQAHISIDDQNSNVVDLSICGDTELPDVWRSASSLVRVTFASNNASVSSGFLALVGFAPCFVGTWVIGNWQPCSITCGNGVETRTLECHNAFTNDVEDDVLCPTEVPTTSRDCELPECPSCNKRMSTSGNVIDYPIAAINYGNNENCVITIVNTAGCISLTFLDIDIQPGTTPQFCDRDYLEIVDTSNPTLAFRICGTRRPPNFQSISGTVELRFHSDNLVTALGYSVYPSFMACPPYAFVPGIFSECDTTCGVGIRERDVPCIFIQTGNTVEESFCTGVKPPSVEACDLQDCPSCNRYYETDGELILSSSYPANYSTNLDCTYTFNNTDEGLKNCIMLRFLKVNLDPANVNGECEDDYLEVKDINYPSLTTRFCGNVMTAPEWLSRSSEAALTFRTDESGGGDGFYVYESFAACSPFGYISGPWSPCNVTCGGGIQTRAVQCVTLQNSNVVNEELCKDPKPAETELCGHEECPSCDAKVGNQQIFSSPNYPLAYGNNQDCEYTISNPNGCISLLFLVLKLEEPNLRDNQCRDFVEITDKTTYLLTGRLCGSNIPPVWRSRSGEVKVQFFSDDQNVYEGFSMYPSFVACPAFGFVTQEYGQCSVTCGEGVRLRQVNCLNLATETIELDNVCTDLKPSTSEPCTLEACLRCDLEVNQTGVIVYSPNYPQTYENNTQCQYTINSLEPSQCVRLYFVLFDLPEVDENGYCTDYISIEDDLPGYMRDITLCGSRSPFFYESLSSQTNVTFITDDKGTGNGFRMFVNFQNCPNYGFMATEYGECSVSCGKGVRTRTVFCYNVTNDEVVDDANCVEQTRPETETLCVLQECPICYFQIDISGDLITTPGFPEDYLHNQDCTYNITNPAYNGCIKLNFLYFELTSRVLGACSDFLTVDDVNDIDPEPQEFCEREAPMVWNSQSDHVVLNFQSNAIGSNGGFTIVATFQQCPDPQPFVYNLGNYAECNVACGEGIETRTVTCVQRATDNVVAISICKGPVPPSQRPCSAEPCPGCDQTFTTDLSFVASPNNPLNYDNNQNCAYNLTNPEGGCINLIFLSFDLEAGTEDYVCDKDFLKIEDDGVENIIQIYCGTQTSLPDWHSRTSTALLTFSSDNDNVASGFNIYATFTECPIFGFVASEYGPCDRACGGGMQTRTVNCQRLENSTVVENNLCNDPEPQTSRVCNEEPCPFCNADISLNKQALTSPDSPEPYGENYDCEYTYTTPSGRCMVLFFININLPPPNEDGICDQDYLLVEDLSNSPVSFSYCGDSVPPQFHSRSNKARVTFHTDNNGTIPYSGFSIYNSFSDCPQYGFTVGEYGICDKECGSGTQTRNVQCVLLSTGQVVLENTCTDQKPAESRVCNSQLCLSCDELITNTNTIISSPNFPDAYNPSRTCTYTINNPDNCVRLLFLVFNVQQGDNEHFCTTDFVKISDLGVDYLNQTLCGPPPEELYTWESRSSDVEIILQSGPVVQEDSSFQIFVVFQDCPENGWVALSFSPCSQTCGIGTQTRTVECRSIMSDEVVAKRLCSEMAPPEINYCEDTACPSCDKSFDTAVVVSSLYPYGPNRRCVYTITNPAPDGCMILITVRLDLDEPDVNRTCDVTALTFKDNNNVALSTTMCGNPPTLPDGWISTSNSVSIVFETSSTANQTNNMGWQVFPNFRSCLNFDYSPGPWQMCSASCEGGVQTRMVQCLNLDNDRIVDEAFCTNSKPDSSQICNTGVCPQECGLAFTSGSSVATLQSPGYGYDYPNNQDCTNTLINTDGCMVLTFLKMSIQSGSTPLVCDRDYVEIMDINFSQNSRRFCGSNTPTESWHSLGPFVRVKFVSDGSVTDEGFSIFYTFTNTTSCPTASYTISAWKDCSTTCGSGIQVRSVTCLSSSSGIITTNTHCPGAMPAISQVCNSNPCPSFDTGPWSLCTDECGSGNQTRNVTCKLGDVVISETLCEETKPAEEQICNTDSCPGLFVGNWSVCSTTCGKGIQSRLVECRIDDIVVDFAMCIEDVQMTNPTQDCNLLQCPSFVTGNWTECPATCGFSNVQTRNVSCENDDMVFSDSACSDIKPYTAQICNNRTCQIICGDIITMATLSGTFSIPYVGGNYNDAESCTITFALDPRFIVQLTIDDVDVAFAADKADCTEFDYIEVIDATTNQICSDITAQETQSSGLSDVPSTFTFTFYSNNDGITGMGVNVTFTQFYIGVG